MPDPVEESGTVSSRSDQLENKEQKGEKGTLKVASMTELTSTCSKNSR